VVFKSQVNSIGLLTTPFVDPRRGSAVLNSNTRDALSQTESPSLRASAPDKAQHSPSLRHAHICPTHYHFDLSLTPITCIYIISKVAISHKSNQPQDKSWRLTACILLWRKINRENLLASIRLGARYATGEIRTLNFGFQLRAIITSPSVLFANPNCLGSKLC
jgi:hypothetical protein